MDCSTSGFPAYHQLLEFTQTHAIEVVMPANHLILCHPLLLLPSIFPSIRIFSNESVLLIRCPKYWSFSFSISPSNDYSGLMSFRMDWLDLLAVQGTLKSLLQHHSSKASILQHSAFFIVQLSHPYMTTGKTIALTRQTFVGKVMKGKSLSRVRLFATPWTVAHQASPSMGFSRQEYWSGLSFPSPGDLLHPGIEPRSLALQADALPSEPQGIAKVSVAVCIHTHTHTHIYIPVYRTKE